MAITLKYGSPVPILAAGFAAGVGRRQNEVEGRGLEMWQRQQQQNFAAEQAQIGRTFQAEQQGFRFDFQSQQNKLGRDSALERQQVQQQRFLDQELQRGLTSGKLELPPEAQRRLQELESGRVAALDLGPAEQQEFMEKYESQKRALNYMARPKAEIPYDERVKTNLGANYEQYKSLPWQFNDNGEMSLPSGFKLPGDDQAKSEQEFNKDVMKRYESKLAEVDDDNKPLYSDENKALQAAIDEQNKIERGRQRLLGKSQPQAPAATQPAGQAQQAAPATVPASAPQASQPTQQALTPQQAPLAAAVPQVTSMEEVRKLPKGTVFRWTDGSVRKVP